jgi:hypothetical protein
MIRDSACHYFSLPSLSLILSDFTRASRSALQQHEREIEMAERERKWERRARLRTVQPHSNLPSASVPPEYLVIPSSAAGGATSAPWGAPPPPLPPVQAAQASDFAHAVDTELNLGDFIYIDDEPPESAHASATHDVPTAASESAAGQGSTPITGVSPFAPS